MRRNERGEIATILTLSTLAVITVTAIVSSLFVNQKKTTSSMASEPCEYTSLAECKEDPACKTCVQTNCSGGTAKCSVKNSSSSTTSQPASTGSCSYRSCTTVSSTYTKGGYYVRGSDMFKNSTCTASIPEGVGNYCKNLNSSGGSSASSTAGCTKHNCSEVPGHPEYIGNYWVKSGRYYADSACTQDKTDFGIGNWCKTLQSSSSTPSGLPYCINAGYSSESLCEQVYGDGQCRECIYGTATHKWEFFGSASGYPTCNAYKWATKGSCEDNCKIEGKACYLCNNNNAPWFHCADSGATTCDTANGYTICGTNCCTTSQTCDSASKTCKAKCGPTSYSCTQSDCGTGKTVKSTTKYYKDTDGKAYSDSSCNTGVTLSSHCCEATDCNSTVYHCGANQCTLGESDTSKPYYYGSGSKTGRYYSEATCTNAITLGLYCCKVATGEKPIQCRGTVSHCTDYKCTDTNKNPTVTRDYYYYGNAYYDDSVGCSIIPNRDTYCGCATPAGACVGQEPLKCNVDYQCSNNAQQPSTDVLFYNVSGNYYAEISCISKTRTQMDAICGCGGTTNSSYSIMGSVTGNISMAKTAALNYGLGFSFRAGSASINGGSYTISGTFPSSVINTTQCKISILDAGNAVLGYSNVFSCKGTTFVNAVNIGGGGTCLSGKFCGTNCCPNATDTCTGTPPTTCQTAGAPPNCASGKLCGTNCCPAADYTCDTTDPNKCVAPFNPDNADYGKFGKINISVALQNTGGRNLSEEASRFVANIMNELTSCVQKSFTLSGNTLTTSCGNLQRFDQNRQQMGTDVNVGYLGRTGVGTQSLYSGTVKFRADEFEKNIPLTFDFGSITKHFSITINTTCASLAILAGDVVPKTASGTKVSGLPSSDQKITPGKPWSHNGIVDLNEDLSTVTIMEATCESNQGTGMSVLRNINIPKRGTSGNNFVGTVNE